MARWSFWRPTNPITNQARQFIFSFLVVTETPDGQPVDKDVAVRLYYLDTPQEIFVELEKPDWFDLLSTPLKSVTIKANDIGGVEFQIRPAILGNKSLRERRYYNQCCVTICHNQNPRAEMSSR